MGLDSSYIKEKDGVLNKVVKTPKFFKTVELIRICIKEDLSIFEN